MFLTYTSLNSLRALLTLHTVLITSGKRPIHTIINFTRCWNRAGHHLTVPHFPMKDEGIHWAASPTASCGLTAPRPITYVRLHHATWPGLDLAAAELFLFRPCPIPIPLCVYSLSLNVPKSHHMEVSSGQRRCWVQRCFFTMEKMVKWKRWKSCVQLTARCDNLIMMLAVQFYTSWHSTDIWSN